MRRRLPLLLFLVLFGCSGDPGTGPVEVVWDRDVCARCNMVLSDRFHAAQVRFSPPDKTSQVRMFDDFGCALLWLDQQPWRTDLAVEIWVSDHRNGDWIDAKTAHYRTHQLTPMEYGLGAQLQASGDTLDFDQAKAHVLEVERRYNVHGAHLKQHAAKRQPTSDRTTEPASAGR